MNNLEQYALDKIIDLASLQNIQDKFSEMTSLSTVTVDRDGTPITRPSNFSKFCSLLRTSKKGYIKCSHCDAEGGRKSMLEKKPVIYTCHAGLTDLSSPIIVNDAYLGSMLCGQVVLKEKDSLKLVNLKWLSEEFDLPYEELKADLMEINSLEFEKVINYSDFLHLFANLIAKMGVANITHSELLEETKEKMKFQQLAKDAEIKSIQAQINPHFLFNTLNTIASMALIEDSNNTAELIYALSDILRYSLNNSENMVKLGIEIENIKKYLYIQKIRYNDKLSYDINISNSILDCKIPSMTLQPIIENAIIHGLEPKKENGNLNISGEIINNKYIVIEIRDNGIGMSNEKLKSLIANINSSSTTTSIGIGMQIVHQRLIYYWGTKFGIEIKSSLNKGTTVSIKIPYVF